MVDVFSIGSIFLDDASPVLRALSWKLTRYSHATLLAPKSSRKPETYDNRYITITIYVNLHLYIYGDTVYVYTCLHIIYTLNYYLVPLPTKKQTLTHIVFVSAWAPLHICFLFFGTLCSARLAWKFPMPCSFWVFSSLSGLWKKWVPWRPEI